MLPIQKGGMAFCKNSRACQTDTHTGWEGCTGKRYYTGYKNISGKGFEEETETGSGWRYRKGFAENRNDLRHGIGSGRNGTDQKGTLVGGKPAAPCAGRHIPWRQVTSKEVKEQSGPDPEVCLQHPADRHAGRGLPRDHDRSYGWIQWWPFSKEEIRLQRN